MQLMIPTGGRPRATKIALAVAALAASVVAGPVLDGSGRVYWVIVLCRALLLGTLAVATNIAWGFTGIFTLGQAVFFGEGAYVAGLLATRAQEDSLIRLGLAAGAVGLLSGLVLGMFLFFGRLRVGELYVGLVTLALSYALEKAVGVWSYVGAGNGITGLPYPTLFGHQVGSGPPLYFTCLSVLLAVLGLGAWLLRSQFGLVMRAVRDDSERAEFLGYRRSMVQLIVFSFTAGACAVAGCTFALFEGFVSPSLVGVALSTQVLVYVLLGGRGALVGPLIGVLILEVGGQSLQNDDPAHWPLYVGSTLLLVILFVPGGLTRLVSRWPALARRGHAESKEDSLTRARVKSHSESSGSQMARSSHGR